VKELEGLDHSLAAVAERAIAAFDVERVRVEYWNQNECVHLEKFLPPSLVESVLIPEVQRLRSVLGDVAKYVKQIGAPEELPPRGARHRHPRYPLPEILSQWIALTAFPPGAPPAKH
jgi:hypothetical protein